MIDDETTSGPPEPAPLEQSAVDSTAEERERPHLVWTTVALVIVALLGVLAFRIWSTAEQNSDGGTSAATTDPPTGEGPSGGELSGEAGVAAGDNDGDNAWAGWADIPTLDDIDAAIDSGDLDDAKYMVARIDEHAGLSPALTQRLVRIELRESAALDECHSFEIELLGIRLPNDVDDAFARYSVDGQTVFEAPVRDLDRVGDADGQRMGGWSDAVVRTTSRHGATLEFVEPGGVFSAAKVIAGPIDLGPLLASAAGGGNVTTNWPLDASGESRVRANAERVWFEPGVWSDRLPYRSQLPPAGDEYAAPRCVAVATQALNEDDLEAARSALAALRKIAPAHPDLEFIEQSLERRSSVLGLTTTNATFKVVHLVLEPKTNGGLWISSGKRGSLRAKIVTKDGDTLGKTTGDGVWPYDFGPRDVRSTSEPDKDNTFEVSARGDVPLHVEIVDLSPTFSATALGTLDLGVCLADLPTGSGTIMVDHAPALLRLPKSDDNRVREIALRWTIER